MYVIGAIINSPYQSRVIIGLGITYMGQTYEDKILVYFHFWKVTVRLKVGITYTLLNAQWHKNEYGLGMGISTVSFLISEDEGVVYKQHQGAIYFILFDA